MSIRVMAWVWDASPYKDAALLMHLALADFADDDGVCWPSQTRLARKMRASVETVRRITRRMEDDGWLIIEAPSAGRGHSARYRLTLAPPETPTMRGGSGEAPEVAETPTPARGIEPRNPLADGPKPPRAAPKNRHEPSVETKNAADADAPTLALVVAEPLAETPAVRAQRLTRTYTDLVPLSRFPAVMGIVRQAINTGMYDDGQITGALAGLAAEGRPVTVDTLRVQMEGLPASRQGARSHTDKFRDLAARYADAESPTAIGGGA